MSHFAAGAHVSDRYRPSRRASLVLALLAGLIPAAGSAADVGPGPGLADLVQVADVTGLAASPDGRRVSFRVERARLDSNDYPSDWYVADLADDTVRQIGPGGAAIHRDPGLSSAETPVWSRDGQYLYYRALVDGIVQLWRARTDGNGARAIVQDDADIRRLELAEDGAGIIIETGASRDAIRFAEQQEYDSGVLVDETVDLAQGLVRGALINGRPATQRFTGSWTARDGLLWRAPVRHRRVDLTTLAVTDVADAPASTVRTELGRDITTRTFPSSTGDIATATWNSRRREGTLNVAWTTARRGEVICADPLCRSSVIAWAAWQPGHDALIFSTREGSDQAIYTWDLRANRVRPVARSEGLLNGGREGGTPCTVAAGAVVCVAATAGAPPQVVKIDLQTGQQSTLFDPNSRLRRTTLQPERLTWPGSEGRVYNGWLFLPPGQRHRTPLFITYYSCDGFVRGGVGDEWPLEAFARAGIAALCVNAARAERPEGTEDNVLDYRVALEGVESVIRLLDQRGLVDPTRVGMGGLSFGSEATLWTMVHSELLAAASVTSPSFEPAYYWFGGVRGRDNHDVIRRFWHLGAPDETPERWRLLSPAANVDRIRAPLLMQMPEQESRKVIELHARLSHSTTPVELYAFPDSPHLKFLPRHKLAAYDRNLDWFRYWLQGYVDPDPLKAAQYRRWEALAQRRHAPAR